jgi:uncharacterized membrane protein
MNRKKVIGFFLVYFLLLGSLVLGTMSFEATKHKTENETKNNEVTTIFKEELAKQEVKTKIKEEEFKQSGRWKPSKQFVMTAIIIASILDIVIILIWAWHENRKKANQNEESTDKKRWAESKWFWYIIGLGIVQPKNNRLSVNWINLAVVIILMYIVKTVFINRLFDDNAFII